jgi:hypothetical protein
MEIIYICKIQALIWLRSMMILLPCDLRGYRLFAHISAALGSFMFTKHANHGAMRKL